MANPQESMRTTAGSAANTSAQRAPGSVEEQHELIPVVGQEISQKVQELTTQGQEMAAEYYQQGRERVLAWQQQLGHQVQEKPLQSLMIAAGLGLLFGLLRRR